MYTDRVSDSKAVGLVAAELGRERERYRAVYGEPSADTAISSIELRDNGWIVFYTAAEAVKGFGSRDETILVGHCPYFVHGDTADLYLLPGRAYVTGEWWDDLQARDELAGGRSGPPTTHDIRLRIAKFGLNGAAHDLYGGTGGPGLMERREVVHWVAAGNQLTAAQQRLLTPPRTRRRLAAPMTKVVSSEPVGEGAVSDVAVSDAAGQPQAQPRGTFVGEFHELPQCPPDAPSIRWVVRAHSAQDEAELLGYLEAGTISGDSLGSVPDVLGAEGTIVGDLGLRTDGEWLWRSDLAYYVRYYHVELDPRFVAHVRDRARR